MTENKINITVTEKVKEIIYDIQNKTHRTGKTIESAGAANFEIASNVQASYDEDDMYQLFRSINNALSELKNATGEFLSEDSTTSDNLIKNVIDEEDEITLSFSMPGNFEKASVDALGNGIHSYFVNKALFDWFTITNKADAELYMNLSIASLDTVKRALFKRRRPERPTYE